MKKRFHRFNGRLALFQSDAPDCDHWERRWSQGDIREYLAGYKTGKLEEFDSVFGRHMKRNLPILEAGCGKGQLVMALSARGYDVEGVDYAEKTIQRIKEAEPSLKVRRGDVYNLDVDDGHYGGYISIGLFEHNERGPLAALKETRRVLHPDGTALITVPYLNRRRSKVLENAQSIDRSDSGDGLKFYQYYYSVEEFKDWIEQAGMEVVEVYPYGVYTGLIRYSKFWGWLDKRGFFAWRLHRRFIHWCSTAPMWLRVRSAHMVLFACRRRRT